MEHNFYYTAPHAHMRIFRFFFLAILLPICFSNVSSQELMAYTVPEMQEMPPKLIPTSRTYWVSLPKDYDRTANRYPVLFLFDGDQQYLKNLILFDIDQLTRFGEMPPCIIVGMMQRNRALDFGPLYAIGELPNSDKVNGDKFFQFIKEELVPTLDKKYRTQDFKMAVGHSLGGLFLLNGFTKDPSLFNGIVALSPALELDRDSTLFANVQSTLKGTLKKQTFFCWASGTEGVNEKAFRAGSQELLKTFKSYPNPSFDYKFIDLPGQSHNLTPIYSMLGALNFLFRKWNLSGWYRELFADKVNDPIKYYQDRRTAMESLYGFREDPTEDRIQHNIGSELLSSGKYQLALPYLSRAVALRPKDSGFNADLSVVQEKLGKYAEAVNALKKAADNLDVEAEDFRERSEKYKSDISRLQSLIATSVH